MARLYADENFPSPVVEALRRLGHDVFTTQEAGQAGAGMKDDAVLAFATFEGRAVLTLNRRHFVTLHRSSADHSGIITCTLDLDFERQAKRIDQAIADLPTLVRQLVRVNRPAN